MGNGTRAFAILAEQPEKDNPLKTVEDDYGMIGGIINNGKRDEMQDKPSIRDRLAEAKQECATRPQNEKEHPGRNTPERDGL